MTAPLLACLRAIPWPPRMSRRGPGRRASRSGFIWASMPDTDIVAHRTGRLPCAHAKRVPRTRPGHRRQRSCCPTPPPIVAFLGRASSREEVRRSRLKPLPVSFARQAYSSPSQRSSSTNPGRARVDSADSRIVPAGRDRVPQRDEQAARKVDRFPRRRAARSDWRWGRPCSACGCKLAEPGDVVDDGNCERLVDGGTEAEFGTPTLTEPRRSNWPPERRKIIFDPLPASTASTRPATPLDQELRRRHRPTQRSGVDGRTPSETQRRCHAYPCCLHAARRRRSRPSLQDLLPGCR